METVKESSEADFTDDSCNGNPLVLRQILKSESFPAIEKWSNNNGLEYLERTIPEDAMVT